MWELDRQTAAKLQQLIPSLDTNQLQGPVGSAIAAVISSDPRLRQALLQGACFFALAADKAGEAGKAEHGGSEVAQRHVPQQPSQLKSQETQAEDVVAVVETSMQKVIEEVTCCAAQQTGQGTCTVNTCIPLPLVGHPAVALSSLVMLPVFFTSEWPNMSMKCHFPGRPIFSLLCSCKHSHPKIVCGQEQTGLLVQMS